ncbi:MAG: S53 family peptidase, partial [Actinomycetota bacterium]|nr:S53 family peptidase [Actinomycetota bacterium]
PAATVARLGGAPGAQRLSLMLPLRADVAGLERLANAVSTFGSPQYGQFQSIAELARRYGASASDRGRVLRFLHHAGASGVTLDRTGLFADATMTVAWAQRAFGTALSRYQSARATRFIAPSSGPRLPAALRGAVTGVVGLDTRPVFGNHPRVAGSSRLHHAPAHVGVASSFSGYQSRSGTSSGCAGAIADRGFTPNQYLTAYDYAGLQAAGATGAGERVALIEIDGYRYSDITSFARCFGLPVPAVHGYGVNLGRPLPPGGESTLDLEVLDAAAPGLKAIDVYESRSRASDVLRSLTAPLQNANRVPEIISASLGTCEPALALAIGAGGVRAVEGELALTTAAGISVLAASGDTGSSDCIGRNGPIPALAVNFPSSSPYVTGVGGTNLALSPTNQIVQQQVWNDAPYNVGAGGGGLSRLFARPDYQRGFLAGPRRGVPDVALLSDPLPGYAVYCTARDCLQGGPGPWISVGGTSAATPLLAGGLALVNQILRLHQKQNLGSANSVLYDVARRHPTAGVFSDVSGSDNDLGTVLPGGRKKPLGCCAATPGYDLATGLGGVDLGKLALLAVAAQPAIATVGVSVLRQRVLAHRALAARVSCSRRCLVSASATIRIPRARSIRVSSRRHLLLGQGSRKVTLHLSRRQAQRIRGALHRRQRVYAYVHSVLSDSGNNVEGSSRAHRLRITG